MSGEHLVVSREWKESTADVKVWKPVYTKILIMVQKGVSVKEIAKRDDVGLQENQLRKIINSPTFRLKMAKLTDKMDTALIEKATEEITKTPEVDLARMRLSEAAERAADTLVNLLNPKSAANKMSIHERRLLVTIAQDILDRVGLKQVITDEGAKGREYSPEEIQSALANAKELEQISSRLDASGSSYVLSREQRSGIEKSDAPEETAASEPAVLSIETSSAFEEAVVTEGRGEPPSV